MERFGEQPKFETRSAIEQKPFENPAVQSFFSKWCEINDSLEPKIVNRNDWEEKRKTGILENKPDGKKILFIPSDLQLWEMIGVMEVVDADTFATKPERKLEAKEKILALGKTFKNAGVYIANRLEGIDEGKEIATALALEFYEYGQSLIRGQKPERYLEIDDIAQKELTREETEEVDRFLAGESLYESRKQRIENVSVGYPPKKNELLEEIERQKTLSQFFRVAKKALVLETKKTDGELKKKHLKLKPWQSDTPIHSAFLERIKRELIKQIETPKQELEMAIFRRGLEKLIKEMRETKDMYEKRTAQEKIPNWRVVLNKFLKKIGLDLLFEQKRIVDLLQIPKLKEELAAVRESGDLVQISAKEREIADRIQEVISNFPRKDPGNNPSEMVVDQYINCVGASILGGALMKEVGLNYLVGDVPRHSILFLVTSDGRVEWRDMLYPPSSKEYLTNKIIKGQREDGKPLTVKDIVAFSKKPKPTGLRFDINSPMYREKLKWVKENQRQYVTVFGPEYGQYVQLLNNTGIALLSLGRHEEALEAYRQAIKLDPKYISPYNNLGNVLRFLGRDEEAIKAYQKAISIDPKYVTPYNGLGNALRSLGRHEEALEAYRQAIKLDPCYALPYNGLGNVLHFLGRYKEAIRAYKKFIKLANSKEDYYLIERAKKVISEMEKVK